MSRPIFWKPIYFAGYMLAALAVLGAAHVLFLNHMLRPFRQWNSIWNQIRIFIRIAAAISQYVSVIYGLWRVRMTNPLADKGYRQWLLSTPWEPSLDLPRGPVWLVWEDLPILGILAALSLDGGLGVLGPALFVLFYSLFSLAVVRDREATFATISLWGGILLFRDQQTSVICMLLSILAAIYFAQRRAIHRLPWSFWIESEERAREADLRSTKWSMNPALPPAPVAWPHRIAWPLILGWWAYCLVWIDPLQMRQPGFAIQCWFFAGSNILVVVVARMLLYTAQYQTPISAVGRLMNGWLIIPKYDEVWIAPLAILLVGGGMMAISILLEWPLGLSCALTTTATWASALNIGPSRRRWQLTGGYRFVQQKQRSREQNPTHWNPQVA